jgi:hypothetical protein
MQAIAKTQVERVLGALSLRRIGQNQCHYHQQEERGEFFHSLAPLEKR